MLQKSCSKYGRNIMLFETAFIEIQNSNMFRDSMNLNHKV